MNSYRLYYLLKLGIILYQLVKQRCLISPDEIEKESPFS